MTRTIKDKRYSLENESTPIKIDISQIKNMLELIMLEYSLADASLITQIEHRCKPRDDETIQQQRTATTGN